MKVFWAIIAVLGIATGAAWLLRSPRGESTTAPTLTYEVSSEPVPIEKVAQSIRDGQALRGAMAQDQAKAAPKVVPAAANSHDDDYDTADVLPDGVSIADSGMAKGPPSVPKPETPKPDAPKVVTTPVESKPVAAAKPVEVAKPVETPKSAEGSKAAEAGKPATKGETSKPEASAGLKVKLEPQDDGSTLVDGKYVMKGAGTKEDPYRVTWEMLLSAEETYRPRLGKKVIPDRLKMIDGKWVRIGGYIAFPVMASSGDEMLMMLNQWDGCCIGVPPTPYDAIEVKLKKAAKGQERLRTSGTLSGKFRVDPYLVKDWLVSLYVMDDGELSETAGTATPGVHGGK